MAKPAKLKRGSDANLFSVSGASEALDRSRRTITRALQGVKPDATRSGLKLWSMKRIVAAVNNNTQAPILGESVSGEKVMSGRLDADGGSLSNQRAKLEAVRTDVATFKLDLMKGGYARLSTIRKVQLEFLNVFRERALNVPGSVSHTLTPHCAEDVFAIEDVLRTEMEQMLIDLSSPEFYDRVAAQDRQTRG